MKKWAKILTATLTAGTLLICSVPAFAENDAPNAPGPIMKRFFPLSEKAVPGFPGKPRMIECPNCGTEIKVPGRPGPKLIYGNIQKYVKEYPQYFSQLDEIKDQILEVNKELKEIRKALREKIRTAREAGDQETLDMIKSALQEMRKDRPSITPEERQKMRETMKANHEAFVKALEEGDEAAIQEHINRIKENQQKHLDRIKEHLAQLQALVDKLNQNSGTSA